MPVKRICCIGAGYVGGPTCSVIALQCPDIIVTVTDKSLDRVKQWNSDVLPLYELCNSCFSFFTSTNYNEMLQPGLDEIVKKQRNVNLFFTADVQTSVREADLIFISVNTPTKTYGEGKGKAPNLQYVEEVARVVADVAVSNKIVVEKSTVPVRASESIIKVLRANQKPGVRFAVLSNPEFLAEGTAVENLLHPDRVLIGHENTNEGKTAFEELSQIYMRWVPKEKIIGTNTWSSELSKLAANAFLAQRISSINSLTPVCEATGADVTEVAKSIGLDPRIGPHFLQASVGFGGSCFQKDILSFVYICECLNFPEIAAYWKQVVDMNEYQKNRFCNKILETMFHSVSEKVITIFGFSFKKDTSDTRESPAITVCKYLFDEGARVNIYDPKAKEDQIMYDLSNPLITDSPENVKTSVKCFSCPYRAVTDSHAIVVCTEWDEFCKLDYCNIYNTMKKPAYIFDGRKMLDHETLASIGFEVYTIGKRMTNKCNGEFASI